MSHREENKFVIAPQPYELCELCNTMADCRPYGPGGKQVCFSCGIKNPEIALTAFKKMLCRVGLVEIRKEEEE